MCAIQHELEMPLAVTLVSVVLITITLSILLHGITVTLLMKLYSRRKMLEEPAPGRASECRDRATMPSWVR